MSVTQQESQYDYFAFISYSSKDVRWGKKLQRKLERYRMPSTICSERGWKRRPINQVFFAPTDIQPGMLSDELKSRLQASKNLIVICSPNSAQSEWVGKEIEFFYELGRKENIHFFIVDGIPNSGDAATECFNPVIKKLGLPEILGANINETIFKWPSLNRERAYVQIISKLLDVEFDSIWQRHKRRLYETIGLITMVLIAIVITMFMIWKNNQPFTTKIALQESTIHNPYLPAMRNAVISLYLDGETKIDTIDSEGDFAKFVNIPHKYLGNEIRVTFLCQDFIPLDTIVKLSENVMLNISRDSSVYGNIEKKLWLWRSEQGVSNASALIDRWEIISDNDGIVRLTVPLGEQKENYIIQVPEYNVIDTIFMPCAEGQIINLEK